MLRTLRAKRIDLADGSVLYRNIYRVRRDGSYGRWLGLARIEKLYRPVETLTTQVGLEHAIWKLIA